MLFSLKYLYLYSHLWEKKKAQTKTQMFYFSQRSYFYLYNFRIPEYKYHIKTTSYSF